MDFKSVNFLNRRVNLLTGNLLPVTADNSRFSVIWHIYSAAVWLIELIHAMAVISGFILAPSDKALNDRTVNMMVTIEASFMLTRFYLRKKMMKEIIQNMNNLLQNPDEILKNIIKTGIKPITVPFIIYGITNVISITTFLVMQPTVVVFEKFTFYFIKCNWSDNFSTGPFSNRVIPSSIIKILGADYLFLKKFGVDVYMMHLIFLLTAQYRYMAAKLTILFHDLQNDEPRKKYPMEDRWTERELRKLCMHQNTILHLSFILKELLSVNFSLLYINSVFRFCFIGILLSTVSLAQVIPAMLYATGSLMQFYLLCSSVQKLSDASTEITDKAFDEGWYQFGTPIKHTFMLLMISSNLECKIAAIGKFNLSLPSFMTVMNQSYSVALMFLKIK